MSFVLDRGKHRGTPIERVPVGYLRWMVNVRHDHAERARAELSRRGSVLPDLEVSGHAIDRASLLLRGRWHETANPGEELYAWLVRMASAALREGEIRSESRIEYAGMSFRFERDGEWPVLKTVLPGKTRRQRTTMSEIWP